VQRQGWVLGALLVWTLISLFAWGFVCSTWLQPNGFWLRAGWVASMAFGGLFILALAFWAAWGWRAQALGDWVWDGTQWHFQAVACEPSGPTGSVSMQRLDVVFDLQHTLLIRAQLESMLAPAQNKNRWSLVSKANAPHLWHGFRCAVYSRA
jgi:hypothetical protein